MNARALSLLTLLACGDDAPPAPADAPSTDAGRSDGAPRDAPAPPRDGPAVGDGPRLDVPAPPDDAPAIPTDVPPRPTDVVGRDVPGRDAGPPPATTARMGHCGAREGRYFPESAWMYQDISAAPTRANTQATTDWLESQGGWGLGRLQIDTSFIILEATATSPRVVPTTPDPGERYPQCDNTLPFPIPAGGRLEGQTSYVCPERAMGNYTADCHMLVVDTAMNRLYEAFAATYESGNFYTTCNIVWDTSRDLWGATPPSAGPVPNNWGIGHSCTSADAAGFPIAPLLFTVEEVRSGRIEHAIRFALPNARIRRDTTGPVFVWPATHAAAPGGSSNPNAPLYGSRWRLRADFDPAAAGLDPDNLVVRSVVYALKRYGMVLSDGGNVAIMSETDEGCSDTWENLWGSRGSRVLAGIEPGDFEIIDTGPAVPFDDCRQTNRL